MNGLFELFFGQINFLFNKKTPSKSLTAAGIQYNNAKNKLLGPYIKVNIDQIVLFYLLDFL